MSLRYKLFKIPVTFDEITDYLLRIKPENLNVSIRDDFSTPYFPGGPRRYELERDYFTVNQQFISYSGTYNDKKIFYLNCSFLRGKAEKKIERISDHSTRYRVSRILYRNRLSKIISQLKTLEKLGIKILIDANDARNSFPLKTSSDSEGDTIYHGNALRIGGLEDVLKRFDAQLKLINS